MSFAIKLTSPFLIQPYFISIAFKSNIGGDRVLANNHTPFISTNRAAYLTLEGIVCLERTSDKLSTYFFQVTGKTRTKTVKISKRPIIIRADSTYFTVTGKKA